MGVCMPVTMKDIATELGIFVVPVSRVMRDHPDVEQETKRRVLERVKALNHHRNLAARALVTGRSHTMALVVPGLLHLFFAELARSLTSNRPQIGIGGESLLLPCHTTLHCRPAHSAGRFPAQAALPISVLWCSNFMTRK